MRKSGRRARRASKAVLLELMRRRKRGRPPIITDPQACKFCGKVFIVLKDFKAHLVSKRGIVLEIMNRSKKSSVATCIIVD